MGGKHGSQQGNPADGTARRPLRRQTHIAAASDGRDRRLATACERMLPVVIGAVATGRAEAETSLAVENASLADVAQALTGGKITAGSLARAYLARIEAYDRGGPGLNSVREINPDALSIAGRGEGVKPSARESLCCPLSHQVMRSPAVRA